MNRTTECTSHCTTIMVASMFIGITNSVLAVPTAAANALVIVSILTTSSLRTSSYLLLTNLAFSDLAIGLFCQPVFAVLVITRLFGDYESVFFIYSAFAVSYLLMYVSVLTATAISVDRYLAIRLKMRYRSVVTVRRVRLFCGFSWIAPFVVLVSVFFSMDLHSLIVIGVVVLTICLVVITVSYTMSFRALKIHCAQIQPQSNQQPNSTTQSNAIDVLKYRKLLKTMLLIVMFIIVCYMSLLGILSTMLHPEPDAAVVMWGLMTIAGANSSLNPVIYLTRMKDIRKACVQILRKLFRCKERQNED